MQIQINTDSSVDAPASLADEVKQTVEATLERFRDRITRVEVHLSDVNSHKGGDDDKRCMMEARVEGRPPRAVTHQAATVGESVDGAAEKLERAIESDLGRLGDRRS